MLKTKEDRLKETLAVSDRISDVISGQTDAETQRIVDSWVSENGRHKNLFEKICSDTTMQEKIRCYKNSGAEKAYDKFLKARRRRSARRFLYRALPGAAAIAICFGLWTSVRMQKQEAHPLQMAAAGQHSTDMSANRPVLTLGDGTRMNVWGDNLHFKETEKGQEVMLGDSLLSRGEEPAAAESYNTLEVPAMCDFHFTLGDGTKVWMNAASTLKYPTRFAADSRTISVSGEIYLEVAKDAGRPFYVVVDGMTIKVLGTSFNVRAYANENDTKVTLIEGKIAAQINDREYTLTPGKQLKRGKTFGGTGISTVDPSEAVAWTKGYYVFRKSRLQEVASTLQNWYGVTIMMTSEASATTTYTGVINKEESLEVFLRRLEEVSNVQCSRNGNYITIY